MKINLSKVFYITTALIFVFNSFIQAQITSSTSSGRNDSKPEVAEQAEARILLVTNDAGRYSNKAF